MDVSERHKNPLLKRDEVEVVVDHEGKPTPSRHDLIKEMATKLHAKENMIIINKIHTGKGLNKSKVSAFIYHKEDDIPKGLLEASKKRMKEPKKAEPAEQPAEQPAAPEGEAPAEEKKEDAPAEEAKEEKPVEEKKEEPPKEEVKEDKAEEPKEENPEEKKE